MISETETLQFSSPQRALVFEALNEAEARTTGYYCIPPFRWEQLHYDLLTRKDHGWEPLPDPMLARVRHLRTGIRNPFEFYRIELNDHSILTAAEREDLLRSSELYPFLVYILTHEMVHMVRLSTILNNNRTGAAIPCNETEEHRVQDISRRILSGYSDLLPRLESFCSPSPDGNSLTSNSLKIPGIQ